ETFLTLQAARACGELRNRKATGFIDKQRQRLQLDGVVADFLEVYLADAAAANSAGRDAGLLGQNTCGELFGGHFAGEETHDAAIDGLHRSVNLNLRAMRFCDVISNVGGERGLAHSRAPGDDDQVGGLEAA